MRLHIKEEYEELRVGGVFEEVLKNISEFWDLRCSKEFKALPIRVSISGVKMQQTQDEEAFSRFWESIVMMHICFLLRREVGYI